MQNKDTGMWEEGRVSSSNEDGSITITFANGINECVVKDPVGLTSKMGEDDTVVQVSSLAARQEDEEFEQDKTEQREERRQHSEGEVIRLKGTNILQDARAEKILYSRHSDTESFQRAKASELFIALPKEYKVGNTVGNRGTLIQPFKIQTFMSNEKRAQKRTSGQCLEFTRPRRVTWTQRRRNESAVRRHKRWKRT